MICNCCQKPITPATIDRAHIYRLPVADLVTVRGQRAALVIGVRRRAVCRGCVERIDAAHRARRDRRWAVVRDVAHPAYDFGKCARV